MTIFDYPYYVAVNALNMILMVYGHRKKMF
jgi:hypothetical protein